MIVAEWSFNVPRERQEAYLRFLREESRPMWSGAGARLSVGRCVSKPYFPYQSAEDDTRFVERVRFRSLADFEAFVHAYAGGDPRFRPLEAYESRLGAENPSFRLYEDL